MIVSDIYTDVKSVTCFPDESRNFSRISDALEVLNNKGNFEALLGYMIVKPQGPTNDIIILPREVNCPLKINIDDTPAFSRNKLYEFTLNGPGSNSELTGWQWADKGFTPIQITLTGVGSQPVNPQIQGDATDNGKTVTLDISYVNNAGSELRNKITLVIGTDVDPIGLNVTKVWSVTKQVTLHDVSLIDGISGNLIAKYEPDETTPNYRQIRISKPGSTAYILFRRNNFRITSQNDPLPIRSKMGLIYMVKALEAYRDENFDLGKALEDKAVTLAQEEQKQNITFTDIAGSTESQTARNLNYNHIDSIIVADIYDDAADIFGPIGQDGLYDKISEARRILGAKAQWDSMRGYVDINTDQYHFITLPRYCEYPIEININGQPADMKNKWFEFHMNGPGECWKPCQAWEDKGEVVTMRDVPYAVRLKATADLSIDTGKRILVQGYYRNKKVFTSDVNNQIDGEYIFADSTGVLTGKKLFDRITRIVKDPSIGFIRLDAMSSTGDEPFMVGYYYPDELEPRYRRIWISQTCARIRMMYRLREGNIKSLTDPIHLKSKTALVTMMRALKALGSGDVQTAEALENKATKLLVEENRINNQSEVANIDFGNNFTISDQFIAC